MFKKLLLLIITISILGCSSNDSEKTEWHKDSQKYHEFKKELAGMDDYESTSAREIINKMLVIENKYYPIESIEIKPDTFRVDTVWRYLTQGGKMIYKIDTIYSLNDTIVYRIDTINNHIREYYLINGLKGHYEETITTCLESGFKF